MKIGVSGASGHLGRTVLEQLMELSGDHEIVAISRSPETVEHGLEARLGDYDAPDRLKEAYTGLDRLLIIPTLDVSYGARARHLRQAIDAACAAEVGYVVLISDVGTRKEAEPHFGAASWVGEQHLMKRAAVWTILRAGYFMESFAQEVLKWQTIGRLAELSENRIGFVSRDDVAASAAAILVGEGHSGAIYNATGPESLSVADRAALVSRITGKRVEIVETSVEDIRQELELAGYPPEYIGLVLDIKVKTAESGYDIVTGDVEMLTGHPPKCLSEVLTSHVADMTV
ncbi:SDR family NAD(P)-dependent oxidoreductase [Sphingomonadales bacterium 56]|uniref:NAD(P)H-binding protein n=1 Tax=unclassified Sphingobium TaxID=2611147 RepID=UPI00191AE9D5|nr:MULTISPECIES: NAD(P)H-binding protein [unclassified Sphingobium]MBY2929148.1 SDR family NAD(P)-dependent oxidoreductase [Sphingomonadales bacterium 56]MBY2959000.1 SDR family NAD(P)-dependent oxidoreductase [Sphingomonadales bacterium 58]CAD7338216.1 Quinone oxidoreductase 2 [Sphingobium sp. S8]CAD7338913.1 Quinone oxidoreductase 2 [Sphingobium sp. S6]